MAIIFMDGFDHYVTGSLNSKWQIVNGSPTVTAASGRFNGASCVFNAGSEYIETILPSTYSEIIVGFYFKPTAGTTQDDIICSFKNAANAVDHVDVRWNGANTRLQVAALNAVKGSSATLALSEWYFVELKAKVDNVVGTYELKIDGVSIANGTNLDTQNGTGKISSIKIGSGTSGSLTMNIDDVYIADTSGSFNNNFLGEITIETIFPTGAGNTTNFTPLSGNNYDNVDDSASDGDTTYNSSATLNNKDTFATGNLTATTGSVFAIQTNIVARKSGAGDRRLGDVIRTNSTDFDGTSFGVGVGYENYKTVHNTNPDTAALWTISEVNAAQFGYKIIN